MQNTLAKRQTSAEGAVNAVSKVLNPFDGQPPGYNYRRRNGAAPSPNGPALPPSLNTGSGGASLEYQPGRPGWHICDIAGDVTELQKGWGNGRG